MKGRSHMEMFQEFIKPELLVLIPVMNFIGYAIKRSKLSNCYIPIAIGATCVFLCVIWVFANCDITSWKSFLLAIFTSITQGLLIAGASVYANQLMKQKGKAKAEKKALDITIEVDCNSCSGTTVTVTDESEKIEVDTKDKVNIEINKSD